MQKMEYRIYVSRCEAAQADVLAERLDLYVSSTGRQQHVTMQCAGSVLSSNSSLCFASNADDYGC